MNLVQCVRLHFHLISWGSSTGFPLIPSGVDTQGDTRWRQRAGTCPTVAWTGMTVASTAAVTFRTLLRVLRSVCDCVCPRFCYFCYSYRTFSRINSDLVNKQWTSWVLMVKVRGSHELVMVKGKVHRKVTHYLLRVSDVNSVEAKSNEILAF